ncbi:hypothetical protein EXN66_Car022296 [Channa argus]|uniref:Uncharacterized protein n=1 Tax=Channa argus TaxID=215402 RepID=A0A6G1QVS4_CHAAH|nr:hypothetical protein EXN66_Car022296 [Channa argus]
MLGGKHPHRRVTFSTTNPVQDLQDASQHSYYDSGLEESETPSSKSSSGPRIGPLTLPEDHYERTTPDGSIGENEHPENDNTVFTLSISFPPVGVALQLRTQVFVRQGALCCQQQENKSSPCLLVLLSGVDHASLYQRCGPCQPLLELPPPEKGQVMGLAVLLKLLWKKKSMQVAP